MRCVAGSATLLARETRVFQRKRARIGRDGASPPTLTEMEARRQRKDQKHAKLPDQPSTTGTQGQTGHAGRVRLRAGSVGLRPLLAGSAGEGGPAAFVSAVFQHRHALIRTTALAAVRAGRTWFPPGGAATATVTVARAFVIAAAA